jgi:hypothetical protein
MASKITQRKIDETCSAIAQGGRVRELDLLLAGFTWAEIAELRAAVIDRLNILQGGSTIAQVDGIPVWGGATWRLYDARERSTSRLLTAEETALHALAHRGISVTIDSRRDLAWLRAQVAAAKELLAQEQA